MATLPKTFVIDEPQPYGNTCLEVAASFTKEPTYLLRFGQYEIFSPRAKFAMEKSNTGDATLVHIRSCFNNKYWVAPETTKIAGEFQMTASTDKPEEDPTNPACTLFRVSPAKTETGPQGFQFRSVRSSLYARTLDRRGFGLSETGDCIFSVRDWENLVILPSQVTFTSDKGNYLGQIDLDDGANYTKFESGLEYTDPRVAYQLFPTFRGYYRIKSFHNGKFLKRNALDILDPKADDGYIDIEDPNTIFECVKISHNVVALRNLGNNLFCGPSHESNPKSDVFCARYSALTGETKLTIGEPVTSREIWIKEYRLPQSRIFNGQVILLANGYLENITGNAGEQSVIFTKNVATSVGWHNTGSVKVEVSTKLKVSVIPFIFESKVGVKAQAAFEYSWGGNKTGERKIETTTKVVVPPFTRMKVSLLGIQATCDVPFSYTQTDLLPDGRTVVTEKHDGLYTGVDTYEFKITSVEVDEHGQELKLFEDEPAAPATFEA